MPAPRPITEARQLVVEGRDAEGFFRALLRELGLSGIQVQNFGGIGELADFLKALRNTPDFGRIVASLGIVRDAETDPRAAFQSVCSALHNAGLSAPGQPMMPAGGRPQVNVLILPNAATSGMLESVCLASVADDPTIRCVEEYLECVRRETGALPANLPKARLHAFLATRSRPGLRLGEAAEAHYWPWDSQAFDQVKQFLCQL
jgi:hypothetical protein